MIDTDKYEGHTRGPWKITMLKTPRDSIEIVFETVSYDQWTRPELDWITIASLCPSQRQNAQLIADAPLLLAEVKRLRESIKELAESWTGGKPSTLLVLAANELKKVIE